MENVMSRELIMRQYIETVRAADKSFTEISLSELHEFKNHLFKVLDNEQMEELVESIKEHRVLTPAIARPCAEGDYELLSGHRRKNRKEALIKDARFKGLSSDARRYCMADSGADDSSF